MPGSRALPGWFSYLPCLWAAVLPASAGHSTLPPPTRAELLVLESRDILREPLNEAVNKEVSSLNLFDRPPKTASPQGLLFANPSLAPTVDTASSWPPPQLPVGCVAAPRAPAQRGPAGPPTPGYRTKHCQPPAPRARSVLFFGMGCALSLGPEEGALPLLTSDARLVGQKWCLAQDWGRTGCFRSGEGPFWLLDCCVRAAGLDGLPPLHLLTSPGYFRAQATAPCAPRRQLQTDWNIVARERMCATAPLWSLLCPSVRVSSLCAPCMCVCVRVRVCASAPHRALSYSQGNLHLERLSAPWNRDFLNPSGPVTGPSAVVSGC